MAWLQYLALAGQIIKAILTLLVSAVIGVPASAPQIRTYIGKQHIALDITVTPLP